MHPSFCFCSVPPMSRSGVRIKLDEESNPGRPLDQPQPKKLRASRPYQRGPTVIPGRRRGEVADEDEGEAACSSSGANSNHISWSVKKQREAKEFEAQLGAGVDNLMASQPQQAAQQSQLRQLILQHKQQVLRTTLPFRCERAAAAGTPCCFAMAGEQGAVYYGTGGTVAPLTQPLFDCTAHGCASITAHPLQLSCVPTAPVKNTKLLDVELVEQYRLLRLKGVGAHGEGAALCWSCCKLPGLFPAASVAATLVDQIV